MQFSAVTRNALLDAIGEAVGAYAILKILSGSVPANCAAGDSGVVLAAIGLPGDWMGNAANGSKTKLGTWSDVDADASGTAGYFRLYATDGTTCYMQGTITATGGGGDLELSSTAIAVGQTVFISGFTLTAPGV